jgi:hypothetical protein
MKGKIREAIHRDIRANARIQIDKMHWKGDWRWRDNQAISRSLEHFLVDGVWPLMSVVEHKLQPSPWTSFTIWHDDGVISAIIDKHLGSDGWHLDLRPTHRGRLSIGIKLHSKKRFRQLHRSYFHLQKEKCSILPPLGSVSAVGKVLRAFEERTSVRIIDSPDVQIQVCSPGRLDQREAAILGVCFYLGSDTLRRFKKEELNSTHSYTDCRFILYDDYGNGGEFDSDFEWWGKDDDGKLVKSALPFRGRTDVLTCRSMHDIELINLVSTLLVHAQYGGYWQKLGRQFIEDVTKLLIAHDLAGLLAAQWVTGARAVYDKNAPDFFVLLSELVEYAFLEYERIQKAVATGESGARATGILSQMQTILEKYRNAIESS